MEPAESLCAACRPRGRVQPQPLHSPRSAEPKVAPLAFNGQALHPVTTPASGLHKKSVPSPWRPGRNDPVCLALSRPAIPRRSRL